MILKDNFKTFLITYTALNCNTRTAVIVILTVLKDKIKKRFYFI